MISDALLNDIVAFSSVVILDLVLAGDNAIVVGIAACGLAPEQQRRVIAIGITVAMLCRIAFSLVAVQLLAVIGLLLAGGLLLLWVAWKMWRELASAPVVTVAAAGPETSAVVPTKSFSTAVWQIVIADVSMSLDNVLAVAGAARDHLWMLVFGLALSVALMGVAAALIARIMDRHRWIAYVGIAVVGYVAVAMIYGGVQDVLTAIAAL